MSTQTFLKLCEARQAEAVALLQALVQTSSHADEVDGVARCGRLVLDALSRLGFAGELRTLRCPDHDRPRQHLLAQRLGHPQAPKLLILGHLDTVFEAGHTFRGFRVEGTRAHGPGIADMKGGLVTSLSMLGALSARGELDRLNVRVLFVGDEEQGSASARTLLEEAGRWADVALCFEAAREDGNVVSARRGYASATIEVTGPGGHAGIAHGRAPNALTQLCAAILRAENLETKLTGLSVSPGGKVQVTPPSVTRIPELASAELELRFEELEVGERALAGLSAIEADLNAQGQGEVRIASRLEVPPFELSEAGRALLDTYGKSARELGMHVEGVKTAGVGDINLVAAMGAACLDGVGPMGGGFHTEREYLDLASISVRAAIAAQTCAELTRSRTELAAASMMVP